MNPEIENGIENEKMEGGRQKQAHLLSQGAYGCIFYPGIQCENDADNKKGSQNFVTKIQKNERTTINEVAISNRIKKIRGYARFFAPIEKQCPVKMNSNMNKEMKKCDVFREESTNPENVYVSNKIRYVGKKNMRRHLLDKYVSQYASYGSNPHHPPIHMPATIKQAKEFFTELLRTHIYLNRGIEQLIKHQIVHNDIRYNNMVFDDKLEVPIFIDFGLSIEIDKLSPETYTKRFYVFDIYPYWCMDTHICNYIFQIVTFPKAKTEKIRREDIVPLINSFIYKEKTKPDQKQYDVGNDIFELAIIGPQIEKFIKKWTTHLSQYVGKTWFELYEMVIQHFKTWDIYSVSVVYMMTLDDLYRQNTELYHVLYKSYNAELTEYIQIMSGVIFETSNRRPSVSSVNTELKRLMKSL